MAQADSSAPPDDPDFNNLQVNNAGAAGRKGTGGKRQAARQGAVGSEEDGLSGPEQDGSEVQHNGMAVNAGLEEVSDVAGTHQAPAKKKKKKKKKKAIAVEANFQDEGDEMVPGAAGAAAYERTEPLTEEEQLRQQELEDQERKLAEI